MSAIKQSNKDLPAFCRYLTEQYHNRNMVSIKRSKKAETTSKTTNTKENVLKRFDDELKKTTMCDSLQKTYQIPFLNMVGKINDIVTYLASKLKTKEMSSIEARISEMAILKMVYGTILDGQMTVSVNSKVQQFKVLPGLYNNNSIQLHTEMVRLYSNALVQVSDWYTRNVNNSDYSDEGYKNEVQQRCFDYMVSNYTGYYREYVSVSYSQWVGVRTEKSKKTTGTNIKIIHLTQYAIQADYLQEKELTFPKETGIPALKHNGSLLGYAYSTSTKNKKAVSSGEKQPRNSNKVKSDSQMREALAKQFSKYFDYSSKGEEPKINKLKSHSSYINITDANLSTGSKFSLTKTTKNESNIVRLFNGKFPTDLSKDQITSETGKTPLFKLILACIGAPKAKVTSDRAKITGNVERLFEIFEVNFERSALNFETSSTGSSGFGQLLAGSCQTSPAVRSPGIFMNHGAPVPQAIPENVQEGDNDF